MSGDFGAAVVGSIPPSGLQLDEPWGGKVFDSPIPLDVEIVERTILAYLQKYASTVSGPLSHVSIDFFPDRPEAYRLVSQAGSVLIIFSGANELGESTTDVVRQEVELEWDFAVCVRSLGTSRGGQSTGRDPGAYQLLAALRHALLGLRLPGFTPMVRRGIRFVKRAEGVWYYQATFAHRSVSVNEVFDNYPPLKRVTFGDGEVVLTKGD